MTAIKFIRKTIKGILLAAIIAVAFLLILNPTIKPSTDSLSQASLTSNN